MLESHEIYNFCLINFTHIVCSFAIAFSDLSAMLSVQDVPGNRMSSTSRDSAGSHSEHSTVDSRPCSTSRAATREALWGNLSPEMRKELKSLVDENRRLVFEVNSLFLGSK